MTVDTKRFAFAVALAWAVWYTICAFLVAVAPGQTQAVFSFAMHYNLAGGRLITWSGYVGGLILTTAFIGVFTATAAAIFNALNSARVSEPNAGWKPAMPRQ
jgi:uncharacterized protein DUF5676